MSHLAPPPPPPATVADPRRPRRREGWWARPGLVVLLCGTAALYLWGLDVNGWANTYYAAAAQAGSQSWSAMFFGATDAGGSITVDKPPLSLWVMAASVRAFGLSPWSLLVPQALMGVATVAVLHAAVRRPFGDAAALLAGAVMALTPVATLMFRYDNPDALLVLLMVGAGWATVRSLEPDARRRAWWVAGAGALLGLGFLTKQLQVALVVPALAGAYLLAAPVTLRRRLLHVSGAVAAMVLTAGWWVAAVSLWPPGARPYIGGTSTNSIVDLTLGYNGLGRLSGDEFGGGAQLPPVSGLLHPLSSEVGWLVPAAAVLLVIALWLRRSAPRTDPQRASLILWGGWFAVSAATFSLMAGTYHSYYLVAMLPGLAAVFGAGAVALWRRRSLGRGTGAAAGLIVLSAAFAATLIASVGHQPAWAAQLLVIGGLVAAALTVAATTRPRLGALAAATALVVLLAGPLAWSLDVVGTAHRGSSPHAVPGASAPASVGALVDPRVVALLAQSTSSTWAGAVVGTRAGAAQYQIAAGVPVMGIGGYFGIDPSPTLARFVDLVAHGRVRWFIAGQTARGTEGAAISRWVAATFVPTQVGQTTLYDLSRR